MPGIKGKRASIRATRSFSSPVEDQGTRPPPPPAATVSDGEDSDHTFDNLHITASDTMTPKEGNMQGWEGWRNLQPKLRSGPGYMPVTPNTPPLEELPPLNIPARDNLPPAAVDFAVTPLYPSLSPTCTETDPDFGFWSYMSKEVNWGKVRRNTKRAPPPFQLSYFTVPWYLEQFLLFGYLACVDSFLHIFTFVPFRALKGLYHVVMNAFTLCAFRSGHKKHVFHRADVYDILRGFVILFSSVVLSYVELSRVYHYIRGEAIIKLYVIFNILEILDKLLSSLGQDLLSALYRTIRDHPRYLTAKLIINVLLTVVYVVLHSLLLFVQLVSLNVAIDSRSNALLPLLVSNNFVEVKSSVFKRFEPENLFQVSCSDVVERFQLSLFLLLILLQDTRSMWDLLYTVVYIWGCEMGVDWVKHFFISKFNRMDVDNYSKFQSVLSHDVITSRLKMKYCLDPTHAVVRRVGFAAIPLACVMIRFVSERTHLSRAATLPFTFTNAVIVLLFMLCVVAVKVFVNICVLGHAAKVGDGGLSDYRPPEEGDGGKPPQAAAQETPPRPPPTRHVVDGVKVAHGSTPDSSPGTGADPVVARVAKLTRYTLHRNRIVL